MPPERFLSQVSEPFGTKARLLRRPARTSGLRKRFFGASHVRLWPTRAGRATVATGRASLPFRQLYARNQILSVTYAA